MYNNFLVLVYDLKDKTYHNYYFENTTKNYVVSYFGNLPYSIIFNIIPY